MGSTISVITGNYNNANLLPGLIESLREQTDLDFEWIMVDNTSTDAIIEQMQ